MFERRLAYSKSIGLFLFLLHSFCIHAETQVFQLVLENHVFTPAELTIPANKKVKIVINNKDDTAEEFDSFDLNRERVIFANRNAIIFVGPLPIGQYEFFGEYHPNSARGVVIVEESN